MEKAHAGEGPRHIGYLHDIKFGAKYRILSTKITQTWRSLLIPAVRV